MEPVKTWELTPHQQDILETRGLDIELLTIRLRLVVASVDRARELGIDWWEHDPMLSSRAARTDQRQRLSTDGENSDEKPAVRPQEAHYD